MSSLFLNGKKWHQCGQNTLALPEEGRDFMCSGNECWLVCNRGIIKFLKMASYNKTIQSDPKIALDFS